VKCVQAAGAAVDGDYNAQLYQGWPG
jgi:hypothetical protein